MLVMGENIPPCIRICGLCTLSTQRRLLRCYTTPLTNVVALHVYRSSKNAQDVPPGTILYFRVQGGNILGRTSDGVESRDHEHPINPPTDKDWKYLSMLRSSVEY